MVKVDCYYVMGSGIYIHGTRMVTVRFSIDIDGIVTEDHTEYVYIPYYIPSEQGSLYATKYVKKKYETRDV